MINFNGAIYASIIKIFCSSKAGAVKRIWEIIKNNKQKTQTFLTQKHTYIFAYIQMKVVSLGLILLILTS